MKKKIEKIAYRLVWNHAHRLNSRGEGLVEVEARQGRRRRYFSTHTYLRPENWSQGQVVGTPDDQMRNYALRQQLWQVEQVELEFLRRGKAVSLPLLADSYREGTTPAARIEDFITQMLSDGNRREMTLQNYRSLRSDLSRYRQGALLSDVDYQFVTQYERWMKSRGLGHNTIVSRLRLLHAVMNEALRRDLIEQDPFRRFKIEQMQSKHGYVTTQQLRRLEGLQRLTPREQTCRDIFLLACYTGLRYSDVKTLRQEHLQQGWIVKQMVKTGRTVQVPTDTLFHGKAAALINRYGDDIGRLTRQTPPNATVNKTLRPLFQMCGIGDGITFHSSRHTFRHADAA